MTSIRKGSESSPGTASGSTSSPTTPSTSQRNSPEQDDVWAQDTHGEQPSDIESSDVRHLRRTHTTAGYRDGISASKEKSLQPGFDEGYSLGAVFGLKVGWILGVLGGICAALAAKDKEEARPPLREREGTGKDSIGGEWQSARRRWEEAKPALAIERLFAPPYWNADGTWAYEVKVGEGDEVTFVEVAEQHPVLAEWLERTKREIRIWGIREGGFDGEEWEAGRVGQLDG